MRVVVGDDCFLRYRLLAPCCWVVHTESVYLWSVEVGMWHGYVRLKGMIILRICFVYVSQYVWFFVGLVEKADVERGVFLRIFRKCLIFWISRGVWFLFQLIQYFQTLCYLVFFSLATDRTQHAVSLLQFFGFVDVRALRYYKDKRDEC